MNYTSCALAGLLAIGCVACQQADVAPTQSLIGEWHWASSVGGFSGQQTDTPASTGLTDTWVLKADSTYQRYTTQLGGGQVKETGTFSLGPVKNIYSSQPLRGLTLRGKQSHSFVMQELSTHLVLLDNYFDGYKLTYER